MSLAPDHDLNRHQNIIDCLFCLLKAYSLTKFLLKFANNFLSRPTPHRQIGRLIRQTVLIHLTSLADFKKTVIRPV